jgi:hypothetical protein
MRTEGTDRDEGHRSPEGIWRAIRASFEIVKKWPSMFKNILI